MQNFPTHGHQFQPASNPLAGMGASLGFRSENHGQVINSVDQLYAATVKCKQLRAHEFAATAQFPYKSSLTQNNCNAVVFAYGSFKHLEALMSGLIPNTSQVEILARLRHLKNVFEVACLSSNLATFSEPAWQVAREYDSRIISDIESGAKTWEGLSNGLETDAIYVAKEIVELKKAKKPIKVKTDQVDPKVEKSKKDPKSTECKFFEHPVFNRAYFLDLHESVKIYDTNNYRGARIPLKHNNINVESFRNYLIKFSYPHSHIMQYVEYGFPLGLWSDAYLEPATRNHSSAYSYYSYLDSFVEKELANLGLTGPFDSSPWENVMISPMMTSYKKPNGRRPVFDASFGLFSLNKNTPEKCYNDSEYEFTFPKIYDLADRIAELGPNCYLWKRDLSRYFLQLKIDPAEFDKLGFIWRGKLYFFTSFVWGTRNAGYTSQWLTSAVSYVHSHLGLDLISAFFFVLNYADDFAGCELKLSVFCHTRPIVV